MGDTMDKNSIEGNAVDYVSIALRNTNIIDPVISKGDRNLSWDGELFVYNSNKFNKSNLRDVIPVQVKGRTLKKYATTHPVEVSDLINFKKKKRILYFVVQMVKNEHKIYYIALQLYDIEKLLKDAGKRKTINLQLTELPQHDDKIKSIIISFVKDAEKQSQLIPGVFHTSDLRSKTEKLKLSFNLNMSPNFSGADIYSSINSQKPYVYYEDENGVEFPVDKFEDAQYLIVGIHNDTPVIIDDELYYDGYDIINDRNGTTIRIGRYISMCVKEHKLTINYRCAGTIRERLSTLSFILAAHKGNTLAFGDTKLPINQVLLSEPALKAIKGTIAFYNDIVTLFNHLGINKELDLDNLTQQQTNNLYEFCQSELYGRPVSLGLREAGQGVLRLHNINIYCFCVKTEAGNKVFSIFNDKYISFSINVGDKQILVSPYLMLAEQSAETFEKIDNINYIDLITSIKKYGIMRETENAHTHLLLKMLLNYDQNHNANALDACITLASMLYEKNDSDINLINLMQTIKRKRQLSKEDVRRLILIKNNSPKADIKLACAILLESKLECEQYLSELDPHQKNGILQYPIMNLYKQM